MVSFHFMRVLVLCEDVLIWIQYIGYKGGGEWQIHKLISSDNDNIYHKYMLYN